MGYKTTMIPWASNALANVKTTDQLQGEDLQGGYSAMGFSSTNYLFANVFNGILKEVSLVTVSLLSALVDLSTEGDSSSGTDLTNETSQADFTTALKALITNQKSMSIQSLHLTGGNDWMAQTPDLEIDGGIKVTKNISANSITVNNVNAYIGVVAPVIHAYGTGAYVLADDHLVSDKFNSMTYSTSMEYVADDSIKFKGSGNSNSVIKIDSSAGGNTLTLPTTTGTVALTSDLAPLQTDITTLKGKKLYEHNITLSYTNSGTNEFIYITCRLINSDASEYTTVTGFAQGLYSASYTNQYLCSASGVDYYTTGANKIVIGVYGTAGNFNLYATVIDITSGQQEKSNIQISSGATITDNLRTLYSI